MLMAPPDIVVFRIAVLLPAPLPKTAFNVPVKPVRFFNDNCPVVGIELMMPVPAKPLLTVMLPKIFTVPAAFTVVTLAVEPRAVALVIVNVPLLTVAPPLKLLAAVSVSMPVPVLKRLPPPLRSPE